jgi:hypothetical protein
LKSKIKPKAKSFSDEAEPITPSTEKQHTVTATIIDSTIKLHAQANNTQTEKKEIELPSKCRLLRTKK